MMRFLLIIPVLLFSLTSSLSQPSDTSGVQDEASIRKLLSDFLEAWNRHDPKAFSMVFSQDADFTNVAGVGAHGRAEIEKFHTSRFATNFKNSHQLIEESKIRFIRSDVAAVDARWEMTGAQNAEGQEIPLRKGLPNFTLTKDSNQWFITVMHNMNLPASK
jgi:uncharacterized protein (TIGR02246 family)